MGPLFWACKTLSSNFTPSQHYYNNPPHSPSLTPLFLAMAPGEHWNFASVPPPQPHLPSRITSSSSSKMRRTSRKWLIVTATTSHWHHPCCRQLWCHIHEERRQGQRPKIQQWHSFVKTRAVTSPRMITGRNLRATMTTSLRPWPERSRQRPGWWQWWWPSARYQRGGGLQWVRMLQLVHQDHWVVWQWGMQGGKIVQTHRQRGVQRRGNIQRRVHQLHLQTCRGILMAMNYFPPYFANTVHNYFVSCFSIIAWVGLSISQSLRVQQSDVAWHRIRDVFDVSSLFLVTRLSCCPLLSLFQLIFAN